MRGPEADLVCAVCDMELPERITYLSVNLPVTIADRMVAVDWATPVNGSGGANGLNGAGTVGSPV